MKTDRYFGHFQGDAEVYRPKGEVAELRKHDPIPHLAAQLRERGLLDEATDLTLQTRVHSQVAQAFEFARRSPYPEASEALQHVFA